MPDKGFEAHVTKKRLASPVDALHPVEAALGLVRRVVHRLPSSFHPAFHASFSWFWRPMVVAAERGARKKKDINRCKQQSHPAFGVVLPQELDPPSKTSNALGNW